jgi:hypothetical protein
MIVIVRPKLCAANRRPVLQSHGSENLPAIVAADRTFPAAVAELESIFRKLRNGGSLPVRVMPLLGAAFLIVFDVALAIGLRGTKMCQWRFKIGGS